jgi:hypothetical protein
VRSVVPDGGEELVWKDSGVDTEHADLVVSPPSKTSRLVILP